MDGLRPRTKDERLHAGHILAECRGEIDLVLLLLTKDLSDIFGERVFLERFALHDTLAVGNVGVFVGGDGNSVALDQLSVRTP